jgi:hypothetical protein
MPRYQAAGPEAIRKAAHRTGLPVDVIHRVTVLEPHAFPQLSQRDQRPSQRPTKDRPR